MSRWERAELEIEDVVGMKALAAADKRIQAFKRVQVEKMEKISYLIRLQVDPEWTPDHLTPLHERKSRRRGQIAKNACRALKVAPSPMSVREITRFIAADLGVDVKDNRALDQLHSSVDGSLQRRLAEGEVEKIEGKPTRRRALCKKMVWTSSHPPA